MVQPGDVRAIAARHRLPAQTEIVRRLDVCDVVAEHHLARQIVDRVDRFGVYGLLHPFEVAITAIGALGFVCAYRFAPSTRLGATRRRLRRLFLIDAFLVQQI